MNEWLSKAASKMDTETQQMSQEGKSIQQEHRSYRFHRPMVPKNQRGSSVAYFLHGDWKTDVGEIRAITFFSTLQPATALAAG